MSSGPSDANAMLRLSNIASQQPQEIRERNQAAEDTYGGILADLGKAGTYDLPASLNPNAPSSSPNAPPSSAPDDLLTRDNVSFRNVATKKRYDALIKRGYSKQQAIGMVPGAQDNAADSIFTSQQTQNLGTGTGFGAEEMRTMKLDPAKAKAKVQASSQGRQVSFMMAESEQLLHRTGPLYDEMVRSTQLPIIEGAAAAARENTENIRTAMARGGAARSAAFAAIQKIRSQEQINAAKGQALSQAHMNLNMWARDNAKNVINFATNWAQNQAGVRSEFNRAMDHASDLMSESALPFMFATQQKSFEYRQMHSAQRRNKVNKWVNYALGIVAGVATYGQNTGLLEQANEQIEGSSSRVGTTTYSNTAPPAYNMDNRGQVGGGNFDIGPGEDESGGGGFMGMFGGS